MKFLSSLLGRNLRQPSLSFETQLIGTNVFLRVAEVTDWKAWRNMRDISRDFLVPWEPKWHNNALSYSHYSNLMRRQWREWRKGTGYSFLIFALSDADKPSLIGGISLTDITSEKGTVGYWIGKPYAGLGYMKESVSLICEFAFETLGLQRLEASCLPNNEPSKGVLRYIGFALIGYAKAYLQINGKDEDHLLWEKVNPSRQTKLSLVTSSTSITLPTHKR